MNFWLGTHHPTQTWFDLGIPLFVSRRTLAERKSMPWTTAPWALDSGGFTELSHFGEWRIDEQEYIEAVSRFLDEMPGLAWAAPMDWMCEPFIIAKTGLSVEEHQRRTIENFLRLRDALGEIVIPVLQGWQLSDYLACWQGYEDAGVHLEDELLVGVGSVCRRQDTAEAMRIFASLRPLRMHGFGVKLAGLRLFRQSLTSCDSMAWSYEARRLKRRHDRQDPLFPWPKIMLCGRIHPDEHKAASCSNCVEWAMLWRENILNERLEEAE